MESITTAVAVVEDLFQVWDLFHHLKFNQDVVALVS